MATPPSTPNVRDEVVGRFLEELEEAADKEAVVSRYGADHPEWRADFEHLAALEGVLLTVAARPAAEPIEFPDFRILRLLDRGGMGLVFEAVQLSLNRRVALKVLPGRSRPEAEERFRREQEALAQLHHSHIVPIHTSGHHGPWRYFAMAYIEGATLAKVIGTTRAPARHWPDGRTPTLAQLAGVTLKSQAATVPGDRVARNGAAAANGQAEPFAGAPAGSVPPPGAPSAGRRGMSAAYFRSVAQVMADAAEAVQHAHGVGILHRDLKPSNLMVGTDGQCWLIDFGLARWVKAGAEVHGGPAGGVNPAALTQGLPGTPQYMAPEQYEGRAEVCSDVWGLGVTLYELLTLRRAFDGPTVAEIQRQVRSEEPAPPRALVAGVPRDLEAVCLKALSKDPARRYPTAQDFADDLRRWLRGEPTVAARARTLRRVVLWARRNKGWATALGAIGLAVIAVTVAVIVVAAAAERRERHAQVELLGIQLEHLLLAPHTAGWSRNAEEKVRAIGKLQTDARLRNQAAPTLVGMDARLVQRFESLTAFGLAFDARGERLLLGGWDRTAAGLVEGPVHEPALSKQAGFGPVAFGADGAPLQVVFEGPGSYVLRDLGRQQVLRAFRLPVKGEAGRVRTEDAPPMALAPDGSFFAAAPTLPDGKATLAVWDAETGKALPAVAQEATGLAFSPRAGKKPMLLAAGHPDGQVTIWALPRMERLARVPVGRLPVTALAFGRDPRRAAPAEGESPDLTGWLLAVGEAGGRVTVWELRTGTLKAHCYGSQYEVNAVAFSPDGMTLASCGRGQPKVWDVATGRLLLGLAYRCTSVGLTFAPDGKRVAVSSYAGFGSPGGVDVWELEPGRGTQALRGLTGPLDRARFSPDGRLVAALAENWQAALWDREAGRLLHVWDVPRGLFADNADLTFNADGSQLAFASGEKALLWETTTGRELRSWALPPGLGDVLAFHPSGKLLLVRWETEDRKHFPLMGQAPAREHPRVVRLRDLLASKPGQPPEEFQTLREFNFTIYTMQMARDGRFFVVEGRGGPDGRERMVKGFDGTTGEERWAIPSRRRLTFDGGNAAIDPAGRTVAMQLEESPAGPALLDLASGKLLGALAPAGVASLTTDAAYWGDGYGLFRRDDREPLVKLMIDGVPSAAVEFARDDRHFATSTPDGSVFIYDLAEFRRRLTELGVGW
jgi:serine/threonine protein kinase/WD40 repeat protein